MSKSLQQRKRCVVHVLFSLNARILDLSTKYFDLFIFLTFICVQPGDRSRLISDSLTYIGFYLASTPYTAAAAVATAILLSLMFLYTLNMMGADRTLPTYGIKKWWKLYGVFFSSHLILFLTDLYPILRFLMEFCLRVLTVLYDLSPRFDQTFDFLCCVSIDPGPSI